MEAELDGKTQEPHNVPAFAHLSKADTTPSPAKKKAANPEVAALLKLLSGPRGLT
jgi:hypothetical protein